MKRLMRRRGIVALTVSGIAVVAAAGTASAKSEHATVKVRVHAATVNASAGPVTRTFSFIGPSGSKTANVVSIDGLTINARCGTGGQPVIFGFSSVAGSDILGRIFDGLGRAAHHPQHVVRPGRQRRFVDQQRGLRRER